MSYAYEKPAYYDREGNLKGSVKEEEQKYYEDRNVGDKKIQQSMKGKPGVKKKDNPDIRTNCLEEKVLNGQKI